MKKQVDKSTYAFDRYTKIDRWSSYFYQIREIVSRRPHSVLEVGVGDGIVRDYLRSHTGISYKSLDVAADLTPDIVGSISAIPLPDNTVDMVCAFEVLEHLSFDQFEMSVFELFRVSKRHVVVSLPHFGPPVLVDFKFPLLPRVKVALKIPVPLRHIFNGQHYWELGKRGYPVSRIRNILKKYGRLESEFVPFENQYHHFFILTK